MTNAAAALPRLDCPSEGHRRQELTRIGNFVSEMAGRTGHAAAAGQEGRRDHLGSIIHGSN